MSELPTTYALAVRCSELSQCVAACDVNGAHAPAVANGTSSLCLGHLLGTTSISSTTLPIAASAAILAPVPRN